LGLPTDFNALTIENRTSRTKGVGRKISWWEGGQRKKDRKITNTENSTIKLLPGGRPTGKKTEK